MLKKLLIRFYHGFAITMFVDMIVYFFLAQALKSVVTPAFAAHFANPISASIAQLMLVGVIGMSFAGAGMIFEIERWSFLMQGIAHFLVTAAVWMPIAWICWSPIAGKGLVFTIIGWTLTYAIIWTIQYFTWRRRISRVNQSIRASRRKERNK